MIVVYGKISGLGINLYRFSLILLDRVITQFPWIEKLSTFHHVALHLSIKGSRLNAYKLTYNQVKLTSYKEYLYFGVNMYTTARTTSIFAFVAVATTALVIFATSNPYTHHHHIQPTSSDANSTNNHGVKGDPGTTGHRSPPAAIILQ